MKRKICFIFIGILLISSIVCINNCYADDVLSKLNGMSAVSEPETVDTGKGIGGAINSIIGLLQVTGSGIALIVITILGIKYILASPSEKADVKKSIMPIIIGCVLLFGGVQLAGAIAHFASELSK